MSITHRTSVTTQTMVVFAALVAVLAAALTVGPSHPVAQPGSLGSGSTGATVATSSLSTVAVTKKLTHTQLFEAHIVTATNKYRKAHHLRALSVTKCLTHFATPWAAHMAKARGLSHQNLGPFLSHCNANYAAENVASGNVTGAQVVKMWIASPDHRANLLGKHYKHVAIGAKRVGSTWYVVQDFSS
jgi:uncharacterized protein YkwD